VKKSDLVLRWRGPKFLLGWSASTAPLGAIRGGGTQVVEAGLVRPRSTEVNRALNFTVGKKLAVRALAKNDKLDDR